MRSPEEILRDAKTIALVGASPNPAKPSHGVMRYLLAQGYDVIPVRPLDCDDVLGVPCVATLAEIDRPIDLVDVFRRPEHTPAHAREAVAAGAKALWLQLGHPVGGGAPHRHGRRPRLRGGPLHRRRPRCDGET